MAAISNHRVKWLGEISEFFLAQKNVPTIDSQQGCVYAVEVIWKVEQKIVQNCYVYAMYAILYFY